MSFDRFDGFPPFSSLPLIGNRARLSRVTPHILLGRVNKITGETMGAEAINGRSEKLETAWVNRMRSLCRRFIKLCCPIPSSSSLRGVEFKMFQDFHTDTRQCNRVWKGFAFGKLIETPCSLSRCNGYDVEIRESDVSG